MHRPVSDVLQSGGVIVYASPDSSVADAVQKMASHNVSSILVLERSRHLIGIFTERDLLRRVVLPRRDPDQTRLADVMTPDVLVVSGTTPLSDVRQIMRDRHIRHVPVADNDRLLGVISLRDVLRHENQEKDFEITQLREYVMVKPYPTYPG